MSKDIRRNSAITVRVMCAALFLIFTVSYLYFYQSDMLALLQDRLSEGRTHYGRLVGTVLITLVLFLLQVGVAAVARIGVQHKALAYLPSMLALAVLTRCSFSWTTAIVAVAVLAVWGVVVWVAKRMEPFSQTSRSYSPFRPIARNLLVMLLMALAVGLTGNSDDSTHLQLAIERNIGEGRPDEALKVGEESGYSSRALTMTRAYALSLTGQMGDRLFRYPVKGGGAALLPTADGPRFLLYPADSLWRWLGARPQEHMTTARTLHLLVQQHRATPAVRDYRLCACLLDKRIDAFAEELKRDTALRTDQLPTHYREALTLYNHLRANPIVEYKNNAMKTDFEDFLALGRQYSDKTARRTAVFEQYKGTYWWYYFYQ